MDCRQGNCSATIFLELKSTRYIHALTTPCFLLRPRNVDAALFAYQGG